MMNVVLAEGSSGDDLDRISLCALSISTRELLSNSLNTKKLIPSEDHHLRDWRGLAHLAKVSVPADSANPTENVIHMWQISSNEDSRPTVGNLVLFLSQIDRWDVIDDLKEQMVKDAKEFTDKMNRPLRSSPINEKDIITLGDVERYRQGLPLENYDAFFLYVDADEGFANDIVNVLEKEFYLRLCLKDRDLVGGIRFEHDAIMRLIANRCTHLIVIISDEFINSEAHQFFFKYAEALAIDQGKRKIVPCVYNSRIVDVPSAFRFYFLLDRSRSKSLKDFCQRLKSSMEPLYGPALPASALPAPTLTVSQEAVEVRCTIEEISSVAHSSVTNASQRENVSSCVGNTQVVQMSDPSVFLSPEKSKVGLSVEPQSSSSSHSKPVSPVLKFKKMFHRSKNSSTEATASGTAEREQRPKTKKKANLWLSKKKVAVAES